MSEPQVKREVITVRLSGELHARLKQRAEILELSLNAVCVRALEVEAQPESNVSPAPFFVHPPEDAPL